MFFRLILCLLSASILASSAAVTGRDDSDWKYKVGWSGVVSPASSIGTLNITTTDTTLAKRNIGGIYICTDINWKGDCGYAVQPVNTCINMGSEWYRKISSLGPDPGTRVLLPLALWILPSRPILEEQLLPVLFRRRSHCSLVVKCSTLVGLRVSLGLSGRALTRGPREEPGGDAALLVLYHFNRVFSHTASFYVTKT
ncbi:hypothetical protein B0H10DRAFT_2201296 [Mycena sp. CBHHK59/15]|nr:hypothetical protein B0H10DRAFT_2201296 [Mycena sp. CBHHK59/15]